MTRRAGGFSTRELATGAVCCDLFSAISTAISWLVGHVADVATSIAGGLAAMWRAISPIFGHVWGALKPIWDSVLKPFWGKVSGWFHQLKAWWNKWAKPVTDFLAKVEKFERAVYAATFGPILDTLTNLQRLLAVLHLSHTAIGRAISEALQTIYVDLTTTWQTIVTPINQIIARIEGYILDVNGLLSSDLLVKSVWANFGHIWNVWWNLSLPALSREGQELLTDPRAHKSIHDHREDLKNWLVHRSGALEAAATHGREVFVAVLQGNEPPNAQT